jgi:hypothetical protein
MNFEEMLRVASVYKDGVYDVLHELDMATVGVESLGIEFESFSKADNPFGLLSFVQKFQALPSYYQFEVQAIFKGFDITFDANCSVILFNKVVDEGALRRMLGLCASKGQCLEMNAEKLRRASQPAS